VSLSRHEGGREGGRAYLHIICGKAAREFHHLLLQVKIKDHPLGQSFDLELGVIPPAAEELHLREGEGGREGGREGGMSFTLYVLGRKLGPCAGSGVRLRARCAPARSRRVPSEGKGEGGREGGREGGCEKTS